MAMAPNSIEGKLCQGKSTNRVKKFSVGMPAGLGLVSNQKCYHWRSQGRAPGTTPLILLTETCIKGKHNTGDKYLARYARFIGF